jgi:regulator of RNase E activity RraA
VGDFAAADPAKAGSIVVIDQPGDQYCAVTGGIMATRMKVLGIRAAVVNGRVRDLRELLETELPVCVFTLLLVICISGDLFGGG